MTRRVDVSVTSVSVQRLGKGASVNSKTGTDKNQNSAVTADLLNAHYGSISIDSEYKAPPPKCTMNLLSTSELITEWRVFKMLKLLRQTATVLDALPAWFFESLNSIVCSADSRFLNMSMTFSVVPKQWKASFISPVPQILKPLTPPADYRPISITPILSRVMERIIVLYPSLQYPPPGLIFVISSHFG